MSKSPEQSQVEPYDHTLRRLAILRPMALRIIGAVAVASSVALLSMDSAAYPNIAHTLVYLQGMTTGVFLAYCAPIWQRLPLGAEKDKSEPHQES